MKAHDDDPAVTNDDWHRTDNFTATFTLPLDGTNDYMIAIEGFYKMNVSGSVSLLWSQNVSNANDVILREGSYLQFERLTDEERRHQTDSSADNHSGY